MTPWDTSFKWPKLEYYSFTLYDSKFIFTSMPSFPESRRKLNSSIKAAHISRLLHILTCQGHMVISVPCWINLRQIFHITRALCQTEVETSAMLPRRPIMFLKRSDMLGKASLHWRKTCKRLLGSKCLVVIYRDLHAIPVQETLTIGRSLICHIPHDWPGCVHHLVEGSWTDS